MPLDSQRARQIVQLIAAGRIGVGALAVVAPGVPLRLWVGPAGGDPGKLLIGRAVGARDAALGLGAVLAARRGRPLRGWAEAGALADAGDAVFTALAFRRLPRFGRWVVLAAAASSAAAAGMAARQA